MTIYLTDDAFSVKAKRFNKMFTSILALFFLLSLKTLYCMNLSINHFIKAEFLLLKSYFLPIKDAYGTYSMTLSAVQRDHVECFLVVLKSCFVLGVIKFILSHQCHKLEQFFQTVGFKDI